MPVAGLKQSYSDEDESGPHRNHPLYDDWLPTWREVRDSLAGAKAIKKNRERYIPRPSAFTAKEYEAYCDRAEYPEVTQRTHRGTIDRVFSKPSSRTLPTRMAEMIDRIDGRGLKFSDFERWCLSEVCALHRAGILADYDPIAREPRLKRYTAESIFDWEFDAQGSLVRVVLDYSPAPSGFYEKPPMPARQVIVVEKGAPGSEGKVWSVIYRSVETDKKIEWIAEAPTPILISAKSPGRVPFVFVGGSAPLMSLLQPLVILARHYLNVSADHRHQLHNSAFIQWWLKQEIREGEIDPKITVSNDVDLYGEPLDEDEGLAIEMGSQRVLMLRNAEVHVTEPSSGTIDAHETKMKSLRDEMVAYGARVFDQELRSNVAAETVWMQSSSNATSVSSMAELVSAAITDALKMAAIFGGFSETDEVKVELNKDYFDERFTLSDISSVVVGVEEGIWSKAGARRIIRQGGLQIGSDEEIQRELDEEGFDQSDVMSPIQ